MNESPMLMSAPAKLNLCLNVKHRRADGYHELDMLNLAVSLCDTLEFMPAKTIEVSYKNLAPPKFDLIAAAANAYAQKSSKQLGCRIGVFKRIPEQAGLGGGSADAAAVLRLMQAAYNALSSSALFEVARSLGADVPFCLYSLTCRVGGIGEKLKPLALNNTKLWFLIIKPKEGIKTAELFSYLKLPVEYKNINLAERALINGDLKTLGEQLGNSLEPAASERLPKIRQYHGRLMEAGALGASMTGSGSAVFGLFKDEAAAKSAQSKIQEAAFSFVCHSL